MKGNRKGKVENKKYRKSFRFCFSGGRLFGSLSLSKQTNKGKKKTNNGFDLGLFQISSICMAEVGKGRGKIWKGS